MNFRTLSLFACCLITGSLSAAEPKPAQVRAGQLLAPKAFRAAVKKVQPSIVTIESLGGVTPGTTQGISKPGEGPTTGLIISPDGYIITSTYNFVRRPRVITVILPDGSRHVASLLGRDNGRKLCLLKIDGDRDLPVPEFRPRDSVKVGQWAVSAGVGYGDLKPALSAGIISATSRIGGRALQTDANISPANYGGPLVDIEGKVYGVCVPLHPQSRDDTSGVEWYDSGIGFAIPLHAADDWLKRLRKPGTVLEPAFLGVAVSRDQADQPGASVGAIQPKSAAAVAGMKTGDRIIQIDDEKIEDPTQLIRVVGRYFAGDFAEFRVMRGDTEVALEVVFDKPPAPRKNVFPAVPQPQ